MSDFEDEMDVDAPAAADKAVKFSGETSKGKRSAANLPVQAEDSLPWYVTLFSVRSEPL
jgi:replication factor C subunit 3/5